MKTLAEQQVVMQVTWKR